MSDMSRMRAAIATAAPTGSPAEVSDIELNYQSPFQQTNRVSEIKLGVFDVVNRSE